MTTARHLTRFLFLGLLLFAADRWWMRPAQTPAPDAAASDDDILFREALALGLERGDPVVERRLVDNMAFVESASDTPAALHARALALGMLERDLIVRRRLIERMHLQLQGDPPEPSETELRHYLALHARRFAAPPQVRISQIFVSRDRPEAEAQAGQVLARLRREKMSAESAAVLGDGMPWPNELAAKSPAALEKLFGADFVAGLAGLPVGEWSGPLASPFGFHLVRIEERTAARPAPLESIRQQVRAAIMAEHRSDNLQRALAARRSAARPPATASGGTDG